GAHAGLAFQLTDDLLGIWGAPEVTGKPVRSDLRARKKSLPVVAALSAGTAGAQELAVLLAREEALGEDDLALAADLVETAGGKAWTEAEAGTQLAAAHKCLADTDMPGDVRAAFAGIAEFITAGQWGVVPWWGSGGEDGGPASGAAGTRRHHPGAGACPRPRPPARPAA